MADPDLEALRRWYSYLWASDTGEDMLANLLGLHNERELRAREYAETTKRALEIALGTVQIPATRDLTELSAIHAHLFGNIYSWAGQLRTVGLGKGTGAFLHPADFDKFLPSAFEPAKHTDWAGLARTDFLLVSATQFMNLNWAHPFREGNGRTTQLFLDRVTSTARWKLDFSRVSRQVWAMASSVGTPMDYREPEDLDALLRVFDAITVARETPPTPQPQPADPGPRGPEITNTAVPAPLVPATGGGAEIGAAIRAAVTVDPGHATTQPPERDFTVPAALAEPDPGIDPAL
ncbi:Fic family protein (plasmid) [Nocardia sp. NBC_01377]|uniref:Fic/DOC family protein n=1 Tax=Nocardia sp. NBC_01377 TaxID=2903595 RepID=UPI002F90BC5B